MQDPEFIRRMNTCEWIAGQLRNSLKSQKELAERALTGSAGRELQARLDDIDSEIGRLREQLSNLRRKG